MRYHELICYTTVKPDGKIWVRHESRTLDARDGDSRAEIFRECYEDIRTKEGSDIGVTFYSLTPDEIGVP